MTQWELKYINLHATSYLSVEDIQQSIARLGEQGWEPVGQINFSKDHVNFPNLLFKRPKS